MNETSAQTMDLAQSAPPASDRQSAPAGKERAAPATRKGQLTVKGLRKSFDRTVVYDNFDLTLPLGSFISVFGPNGCGKSTLINMISGLMPRDGGEVLYDGRRIRDTRISYVFQNYREALFPWLRAVDNIHYPLKLMGMSKADRNRRVEELVADFGITIDLNTYPYMLSGGQQQAVSILRALAPAPEVLFLDEPFSALDYEMTLLMREKLQAIYRKTDTTIMLVSHDLEEAVQMADLVLLLTRRPTRIAEIVRNPLPRPRDLAMLTQPEFVALRSRCLEIFQREARVDTQ
ncbi:ABC transporter ATP-binding protein [Acuticoccus sp. MNP-M23]|uniref:ABC transporter ATP-binding protein n=1 Tax=Acuticoccus sp. MNP-M23 TaxID=3072793 RepID=UPI0028160953|nr:ABC transporter ATP-binding protein [Acuticoccus sp. MNP-M23]WMS43846.1 ABC transporter ATP-binding protein [Acuticoccus sp. MNP-M23]